jgi:hypothetical protein
MALTQPVLLVRTTDAYAGVFSEEFHRQFISRYSVDPLLYYEIWGGIYGIWRGNYSDPTATEGAYPIGSSGWWYVGKDGSESIILYNPESRTWRVSESVYASDVGAWRVDQRVIALVHELGAERAASSLCTFEFVKVPAYATVTFVPPHLSYGEDRFEDEEHIEWSLPLEQMLTEMAKMLAGVPVETPHPYTTDLIRLKGDIAALRAELTLLCKE